MKTAKQVSITLLLFLLPLMNVSAQNQEATAQYLGEVSTGMKNAVEFTNWQGVSITMYSNLNNSLPLAQYWSTSEGFKTGNVPTDENDRFLFRSFTKTLTATIILQLQEEGKVHIDSALSNYIEPVSNVDSTITLRELLSMRANVCNYIQNSWAIIDEDPTRIFDTREILELALPEGPCNEEKEYNYNDTNFQLLGLVIESVTGKAGEDVFKSRFIVKEDSLFDLPQPWTYGITPITIELAPIDVNPYSLNGVWTEDNEVAFDQFGESLNAVLTAQKYSVGVVGRTEDMIRLLAAILTPGQLLSQESIEMMTDIIDDNYGLGLQKFDFNDEFSGEDHVLYGHIGAGLNVSTTFYNPVRKIGFSFAANLTQQNPGVLLNNLTDVIRNNYERLLTCRLENGCAGMITPNPLKGRVASYQGDGSIQVEYVDWDQKIDTVSFLDDGVVGGEIVFDSLGQGFNIFDFDEMTFVWGLQSGFFWMYQGLTDISFDISNYRTIPNPAFGSLLKFHEGLYPYFEFTYFNGRSDSTIVLSTNCSGYTKTSSSESVHTFNSPDLIAEMDSALVTYGNPNIIFTPSCNRIFGVDFIKPRFHYDLITNDRDDYWLGVNDRLYDVHLPPSFYTDTSKTYPIVMFLHGASSDQNGYEMLPELMWNKMESGEIEEMILVKPDGSAPPNLGSFYTHGRNGAYEIEDRILEILLGEEPPYNYLGEFRPDYSRTCLMGHSMGGYGAMKLGLKNSEEINCIVSHSGPLDLSQFEEHLVPKILEENGGVAPYTYTQDAGIFTALSYAAAAAFGTSNEDWWVLDEQGELIPGVYNNWIENSPADMVRELSNSMNPPKIYFDVGTQDELEILPFNEGFKDSLNTYGFRNKYFYETYEGDHSNKLVERFDASLEWINDYFLTGEVQVTNELDAADSEVPEEFSLSQNYPNPFNPSTNISFELPEAGLVQLKVYNLLGQEVANLVDGNVNAGNHSVNFDASNLSSGMYIYRLTAGNQSFTKKMMLIK